MRTHAEEGHVGGEASEDPGSPLPASMIASLRAVSSAALYAVLRGAEFSRSRYGRFPSRPDSQTSGHRLEVIVAVGVSCQAPRPTCCASC